MKTKYVQRINGYLCVLLAVIFSSCNAEQDAASGRDGTFRPPLEIRDHAEPGPRKDSLPLLELDMTRVDFGRSIPDIGEVSFVEPDASADTGAFVFAAVDAAADEKSTAPSTASLALEFEHAETVPGERWLAGVIRISARSEVLKNATVTASLHTPGNEQAAAVVEAPAGTGGQVFVNMRDVVGSKARISVVLRHKGELLAADEAVVEKTFHGGPTVAPGERIPVLIDQTDEYQPASSGITFGVAFAPGQLWNLEGFQLVDDGGNPVPAQFETTAQWFRDGSIKWARVDARIDPATAHYLEYRPEAVQPIEFPSLNVLQQQNGTIAVTTADTTYVLGAEHSPIQSIVSKGSVLASANAARGLYVVDQNGRIGTPDANGSVITIEAAGPMEASVKIEGPYTAEDGEELARHLTRVEFYAGSPEARVFHTLILSRDSNEVWFREYGWEMDVAAGESQEAWFGDSINDWREHKRVELDGGIAVATMLQEDHVRFFHGYNRFTIATFDKSGQPVRLIAEGAECGDWAALVGNAGGLLAGVRNAAHMHPKEFCVSPGRINLMLFSPNAGMELDFKLESRIEYLDLRGLVDKATPHVGGERAVEGLMAAGNNALGWSRTHEMVIAPVEPEAKTVDAVASAAGALSFPVYATTDPAWLCASRTMGNMHPYDPERFPKVEAYVETYMRTWREFIHRLGQYGILDYGRGPQFVKNIHQGIPNLRRNMISYTFKQSLWYLYARSGHRNLRDFARLSNRFFLDCYMVHWDDLENNKRRGFYAVADGSDRDEGRSPFNLPIPWGSSSAIQVEGTSDLSKFLMDYYLTGYRRGRDIAEDYAASAVAEYTSATRLSRRMRFLNEVVLVYALEWDPRLRAIADNVVERFYDPQSAVNIDPGNPYGSTYKSQADFVVIWRAYDQLRDPRLKEILDELAEYHSYSLSPDAFGYMPPHAYVADYLYRETGDRSLGEYVTMKLRGLVNTVDENGLPNSFGIAGSTFATHGFAIAQTLALETGAWNSMVASYSGLNSQDNRFRWFFHHGELANDVFRYSYQTADSTRTAGLHVRLRPSGATGSYAYDLSQVTFASSEKGRMRVPPDVPKGEFEIEVSDPGTHALLGNQRMPLVLNIEGFWRPIGYLPLYFSVPEHATNARIFLEQEGYLTAPNGEPVNNGQPLTGWVDLDGSDEGLYRLTGGGLISGENFPPYYAFGDPALYFKPESPSEFRFEPEAFDVEVASPFALDRSDRFAISLNDILADHAPLSEGTIEFYYKPALDAVEMDFYSTLLLLRDRKNDPVELYYYGNRDAPGTFGRYLVYGRFPTLNKDDGRIIGLRPVRPLFWRKDRWYHVALTWGTSGRDARGNEVFTTRLFINGATGRLNVESVPGRESILDPTELVIGPGMPGQIASLRISDKERYTADFKPPTPAAILADPPCGTLGVWDFVQENWRLPGPK